MFAFIGRLLFQTHTAVEGTELCVDGFDLHVTILDRRDSNGTIILMLNDEYGIVVDREEITDLRKERYKINSLVRRNALTRHVHIPAGWLVFQVEQKLGCEPIPNPCVDG